MKTLSKLVWPAVFAASAVFSTVASATPVTVTAINPAWSGASGGSNIVYNKANAGYTDVRWGTPTDKPSGLGFNPTDTLFSVEPFAIFKLGDLKHYNNPIDSGTAAESVNLNLGTSVLGGTANPLNFGFKFLIDETPNTAPCKYKPADTPCPDQITFQNLTLAQGFMIGGISYTLELLGFSSGLDKPYSTSFISQEGGTNTIGLYARFTEATKVPEPGSLALLGLGLAGLVAVSRRKQKSSGLAA